MEGTQGGTALTLVSLVIAQLQARGAIDLNQIEQALRMLVERPITPEQIADARNALSVVQGLQGIPSS